MGKSGYLFGKITEVQDEASVAIYKEMRKRDISSMQASTPKESYLIKISKTDNTTFKIDDGMDTYTERTLPVEELVGILENMEEE